MRTPIYYTIDQMMKWIEGERGEACRKLLQDKRELFQKSPGSRSKHQAWPGGYLDHLREVMNIGVFQYSVLDQIRPLPFTLSDALLVLFLHDLEKPWVYEKSASLNAKENRAAFRLKKLERYHIRLSDEQQNAMKYVEGENEDYDPERRVIGPLGAFCHICDYISARLWFDHPLPKHDPWPGAKRGA